MDGLLTMLSKRNRGRGPVCNSNVQKHWLLFEHCRILGAHDAESSETLWRPLRRPLRRLEQSLNGYLMIIWMVVRPSETRMFSL
jgi:hypothetical protein